MLVEVTTHFLPNQLTRVFAVRVDIEFIATDTGTDLFCNGGSDGHARIMPDAANPLRELSTDRAGTYCLHNVLAKFFVTTRAVSEV